MWFTQIVQQIAKVERYHFAVRKRFAQRNRINHVIACHSSSEITVDTKILNKIWVKCTENEEPKYQEQ